MSNILIGVLVDVSGSMKENLQLKSGIDDLQDEQITRVQSIFTTVINVVQQEAISDKHELFALAFGLEDVAVCDLLTLLEVSTWTKRQGVSPDSVRKELTELFEQNGAPGMNGDVWGYCPDELVDFILSLVHFDKEVPNVMMEGLPASMRQGQSDDVNYRQVLSEMFAQNGASFVTEEMWYELHENQLELVHLAAKLDVQTVITELFFPKRMELFGYSGGAANHYVKKIVKLLAENGAPYAQSFVEKYVTPDEAELFYNVFCDDKPALKTLVGELPIECKLPLTFRSAPAEGFRKLNSLLNNVGVDITVPWLKNGYDQREEQEVRRHADRAMLVAKQIIKRKILNKMKQTENGMQEVVEKVFRQKVLRPAVLVVLKQISHPKMYQFRSVIKLLNEITAESHSKPSQLTTKLTASQLSRLSRSVEPFIFGGTPMCEALRMAESAFNSVSANPMVLFMISDGQAADGDPTVIANSLKKQGVIIFTCLLTSENIAKPRQLYYESDPSWKKDQRDMFEMSSVIENSHSSLSVIFDQNWTLPSAGKCHLFLQANHPDIINEFSSLVHKVAENNNVILNIMGRVSLDMYINSAMSSFKPNRQVGGTCYANAVAAVLHLAMRRIYGREGGVPDFVRLLDELIKEYGYDGAYIDEVLDEWCSKYRLHYEETDENGARQAINARRPVVARFHLNGEEWGAFGEFFEKNPQGILRREDLSKPPADPGAKVPEPGGHAVVLIKIDPDYLLFMNSWGTTWADGGLFRVRDHTVLNLTFYDVYWTLNDLLLSETRAYEEKSKDIANDVMKKVPENIKQLPYECPMCKTASPACAFKGHWLMATCPKCNQTFEPTALGFLLNG